MNHSTPSELRIRIRPDIQWTKTSKSSSSAWVARDPVSLHFFYLSEIERAVALAMDGKRTLGEVLQAFRKEGVSDKWLLRLVAKLENACLTVPRSNRTGESLWKAQIASNRRNTMQFFMSPLAIRFKLLDPTRLLEFLSPLARLLFYTPFVLLAGAFGVFVASNVLLRLLNQPGALQNTIAYLDGQALLILLIVFACVKSLHELGHAFACRKWESECHEIGLFFLVFAPCLYCDTTDSWKLNRWRRACIAAAGIYVELLIAALAGGLWLWSVPGSPVHVIAANTMIICSVSTLLVNANPLLRYDGYYVLSDLWGVPNLHEQSREAGRTMAVSWLSGKPFDSNQWDASPVLLAAYSVAAWLYRHFVVLLIMWVVWQLLDRTGIRLIGGLLVLLTLIGVVLSLVAGGIQFLRELVLAGEIRLFRAALALSILLLAGYAFFFISFDTYLRASGFTTFAQMNPIYVEQSGTLVNFSKAGEEVASRSELGRLTSPALELSLIETRGQVAELEQRREHLNKLSVVDESAYTQLATVAEQLAEAKDRLSILDSEYASLQIMAETSGVLIANRPNIQPALAALPDQSHQRARFVSELMGSYIQRGTQLGWIAEPKMLRVKALVIEHDAELLRIGTPVRCRWECDLNNLWPGEVEEIAPEPIRELPECLIGDQSIAFRVNSEGKYVPMQPYYEVKIRLANWPAVTSFQSRVQVHFETLSCTPFQWLLRYFDRNFRFEL